MAKTQYSLSCDAAAKGVPTGFTVLVRDVRAAVGAGYIYPICGDIMTIPGEFLELCFVLMCGCKCRSVPQVGGSVSHCLKMEILYLSPSLILLFCSFGQSFYIFTFAILRTGLPTRPGFYDIDVDLDTGRIIGLF